MDFFFKLKLWVCSKTVIRRTSINNGWSENNKVRMKKMIFVAY